MMFPEGNRIRYAQKGFYRIGVPSGISFQVKRAVEEFVFLVAPGYGETPSEDGPICVRRQDLPEPPNEEDVAGEPTGKIEKCSGWVMTDAPYGREIGMRSWELLGHLVEDMADEG